MSERKVLNKYYPLDFDPSKIPKLHLPRSRQFSIRIMAPFNMRCNLCGEYIYKGKKFNSRSELVEDEDYLGVKIRRFYIRCPRCVSEISFKTDPERTDYELEAGAVRNFEPLRTAEQQAQREKKEKDMEEANNPMKVLENRTKASWQEMEMLETLEELKELNSRHATVDHDTILQFNAEAQKKYEENLKRLQDEEDEKLINSIFGKTDQNTVKRLADDEEGEEEQPGTSAKKLKTNKPTDILIQGDGPTQTTTKRPIKKFSSLKSKSTLGILVKKKAPAGETKGQTSTFVTPSAVARKPSVEAVTRETSVATTDQTVPNLLVREKAAESATDVKNINSLSQDDFPKTVVSTLPTVKIQETNTTTSDVSGSNPVKMPASSALCMLGNYTDSESDHSE